MSFQKTTHQTKMQARALCIATILLKGRLGETSPISMTHSPTTLTTPNNLILKPKLTTSESRLEPKTHLILC